MNILNQLLTEADKAIPNKLYHATYKALLKGIKEHGLGGNPKYRRMWEDSAPGTIYLATSKDVAESYAESSDIAPESWLDNIIIFEVLSSDLDKSKLSKDKNVQDGEDTLEYKGIIAFNLLKIVK